jgi:hypothetical protein
MPDHEDALFRGGQGNQRPALFDVKAQRFFDKHILAGQQCLANQHAVSLGGRGDGHRAYPRIGKHSVERFCAIDISIS